MFSEGYVRLATEMGMVFLVPALAVAFPPSLAFVLLVRHFRPENQGSRSTLVLLGLPLIPPLLLFVMGGWQANTLIGASGVHWQNVVCWSLAAAELVAVAALGLRAQKRDWPAHVLVSTLALGLTALAFGIAGSSMYNEWL